jgi:enoyl-CoA hydratase/carnithine racemase
MKLDYVTIEKRDGAAIVRFDRKQNLNAFNEKLVIELTQVAKSFHECVLCRVRSQGNGRMDHRERRS